MTERQSDPKNGMDIVSIVRGDHRAPEIVQAVIARAYYEARYEPFGPTEVTEPVTNPAEQVARVVNTYPVNAEDTVARVVYQSRVNPYE